LALRWLAGALLLLLPLTAAGERRAQAALVAALKGTPAVGLVVALDGGERIAGIGDTAARSAPGSLLKPLFLAAALERGSVLPGTTVFCRRRLRLRADDRDWNLDCTHPQAEVAFTAQDALAYSCNRYFADLADRLAPEQTAAILQHYGLVASTPQSREQKELLVLGLTGILASPAQMAAAYRKLANELKQEPALKPVRAGLQDSVTYGMAHAAAIPGANILGKTGTATDREHGPSHGWFAGIGSFRNQAVAVVIYLPRGNGGDAARLGQHFFLATASSQ
jgi:cell division protein FtsI/penicillin-binding protein 2